MKRITTLLVFLTLLTKSYGSDTTSVRIAAVKGVAGSKSWEGLKEPALKRALVSMDSLINSGKAVAEDYFNRGALKEILEDHTGALPDYDKAIAMDGKFFGAMVNRSVLLMSQKKYEAAGQEMDRVIRLFPNEAIAYNNRGFLLQQQKRYEAAIADYSKSCELDKTYINPFVNKIRCYILLKKYKEAKALCDELLLRYPGNPGAFAEISDFHVAFRDLDAALLYLDKGVNANKRDPEMYICRSQFKDDVINQDEDAIRDCDTAIALAPQSTHGYFARCRPLFDLHQYDRIIADCNKALALDSTFYEAWVMRGDAYDLSGYLAFAINDYEHAIRMKPNREAAYIQLEVLYTSRNDIRNGIPVLNRLLKADPENEKALFQRGHLNLAIKDFKGAKEDFLTLSKLFPDNSIAFYFLAVSEDSLSEKNNVCRHMKIACDLETEEERLQHGLTLPHVYLLEHCRDLIPAQKLKGDDLMLAMLKREQVSDWKGMIPFQDEFIKMYPDSAFMYYTRGKNKRKTLLLEEAIIDYKKAISLNSNIPDAWISMGVAQQLLNLNEEAMQSYKKVIELDPSNEMPYNNIGSMLLDDKKYLEAIEYFKQAISRKPDYLTAIRQLGECYEDLGDKKNACLTYRKAEALGDGAAISKRIYNCN